jgi:excisionase family DNA binding protein
MTTATDTLLTSAEVAERLRIPVRTLDTWAYTGRGPDFIRVGRHRRYRDSDVDTWIAAQTRTGS